MKTGKIEASFRDPSGFVFHENGVLYRQVNKSYAENYDMLMKSGLYEELVKRNFLVKHEEASGIKMTGERYKVIKPELIPFISYPYEWSFSQLKDAALLTLKIEKVAIKFDMTLKDASAYNIQFREGKPVLIDTLSFSTYRENTPWVAYRQFCSHFVAPLALMSQKDIRLSQLLRIYIDGIPLDLASRLLPFRSWFKPTVFFHVHMHSRSQQRFSETKVNPKEVGVNRFSLDNLLESLYDGVSAMRWKPEGTEWDEYYSNTNYSDTAMLEKGKAVSSFISKTKPEIVWDLGGNDGFFSRLASDNGIPTISFDIDPAAIEKNYLTVKKLKEKNLLPLVLDLTNPSPSLGWGNEERESFAERGPADLALALALIHHLTISNNVPFEGTASYFSKICKTLIIEFVPKDDSQVQRLLKNRADIFESYTKENFEEQFNRYFKIEDSCRIPMSKRVVYLMSVK